MNINPNPDPAGYLSFYTREQAEGVVHQFLTGIPLSWQKRAENDPILDALVAKRPPDHLMTDRERNTFIIVTAVDVFRQAGLGAYLFATYALLHRKIYGDRIDPRVYACLITAAAVPDTIIALGIEVLLTEQLDRVNSEADLKQRPPNDSGQDIGLAS